MNIFFNKYSESMLIRGVGMILLLIVFQPESRAQLPNGSYADEEIISLILSNQALEQTLIIDTLNPDLEASVSIAVHIVNSIDGNPNFDTNILTEALPQVNAYFSAIGLQFGFVSFSQIDEYEYGFINHNDSTQEMRVKYAQPRQINLFIVDSVQLNSSPVMGYADFPGDSLQNSMFIAKDQVSANTVSALFGNFLGLLRTHEMAGGQEFEDGTDCEILGDYLCDTHGDGGVFMDVDESCLYKGFDVDPNGRFYTPSVANIMSDSPDACRCRFTPEQYRRMKYYYLNYRSYLK